ncbi:MAG: hypothetical protein H7338_11675 [Candidatus Sericytochromatia bacterium]|nr:hypothetical protein [Candidatus Sericytochromatia bacterium]
MATYRFRFIRTHSDKVVGVALCPPEGGLTMRIGQREFDFDVQTAPKLASLDLYIETIADKPEFKAFGIHNVSRIHEIELDRFISMALFQQKVQSLNDD